MEPPTAAQSTQRASDGDEPGPRWEGLRSGLGTFRRAFHWSSQRASGQTPKDDPGLLRRGSHFLLRSLRRTLDSSAAADQPQAPDVPGVAQGLEAPSAVIGGANQKTCTGVGPEELEPGAGEGFTNSTKFGRKQARGWSSRAGASDRVSSPRPAKPQSGGWGGAELERKVQTEKWGRQGLIPLAAFSQTWGSAVSPR